MSLCSMFKAMKTIEREIESLKEENVYLKSLLNPATPFICGHGGSYDNAGLPETLLVAPAYGADVRDSALYVRVDKRREEDEISS